MSYPRTAICVCGKIAKLESNRNVPEGWLTLGIGVKEENNRNIEWKNLYCSGECLDNDMDNILEWVDIIKGDNN